MNKQSTLQEIEMVSIYVGNTNPRKTFDEQSLKELAQSIQDKGVLQPILVRPHSEGYELVCGERRYKASIMAGLSSIPANIRELSDDEAFEMQIIENLERKDVHPLEEADAFKRMLDSGKYCIADIAAKFAKPETFIAQRLKFVDLIEPIKKDFYEGKLGIGHAIELARLGEKQQKDIHQDSQSQYSPGYGSMNDLKRKVRHGIHDLKKAVFSTDDGDLLPEAGPCSLCPKRAGANPVLFPDEENPDSCFDVGCYEKKLTSHIEHSIASIINEGKDIHLARNNYSPVPEFIEQLAKQNKIPIWKEYDDFRTYGDGKKVKVFYINGQEAGKIKKVYPCEAKAINSKANDNGSNQILEQISKIEERAKRALELDNVKIFQAIKEDKKLYKEYALSDEPLTDLETKAMWYLFRREALGYEHREHDKLTGVPDSYRDTKEFHFYEKANLEDLKLNSLVRMAIKSKLTTMHEPNFESCTKSKFYFEIISAQMPQSVQAIVDAQTVIAEKRIARTNAKLAELKGKGEPEDSLETRLEKLVELGFVINDKNKSIGTGGIAMAIGDIEKQSAEEFNKTLEAIKTQKSKGKKSTSSKAKSK